MMRERQLVATRRRLGGDNGDMIKIISLGVGSVQRCEKNHRLCHHDGSVQLSSVGEDG